jgi:hypothetical protein
MGMGARSQTVVTMATKPPMPDDVSIDELREAVEHMHGVPARFIEPVEACLSCVDALVTPGDACLSRVDPVIDVEDLRADSRMA